MKKTRQKKLEEDLAFLEPYFTQWREEFRRAAESRPFDAEETLRIVREYEGNKNVGGRMPTNVSVSLFIERHRQVFNAALILITTFLMASVFSACMHSYSDGWKKESNHPITRSACVIEVDQLFRQP